MIIYNSVSKKKRAGFAILQDLLFITKIAFFSTLNCYVLCAQSNDKASQITSLYELASQHIYTNQDSAYHYYQKIHQLAVNENNWNTAIDALFYINHVCGYHYNLSKFKKNLKSLDSLLLAQRRYIDTMVHGKLYKNYHHFDKGNYYFKLGNYKKAKTSFQNLIATIESQKDTILETENIDLLINSYDYLGAIYKKEEKFELAKNIYKKNLRFLSSHANIDSTQIFPIYNLLAEICNKQQEYKKANTYLKKTLGYQLRMKSNNKRYKNSIITSANILAKNYIQLDRMDSAKHYLAITKAHLLPEDPFRLEYHLILSEIFMKDHDYNNALKELENTLKLAQSKWKDQKHPDIAKVYNTIGEFYKKNNNPNKALDNFQCGLQQLAMEGYPNDYHKNLSHQQFSDKTLAINILKNKAQSLFLLNDSYANTSIINTVTVGMALLDTIKPTFQNSSDKLILLEGTFGMFESGIEAAYQRFKNTNDSDYIDKAFLFAEKSKGVLLLEALWSAKAESFGGIPEEILEREKQLKSLIVTLEKKIQKSQNSSKIEEQLFATQKQYNTLINTIESKYKRYYDLKYNTKVSTINMVQKTLTINDVVLSYFYGERAIYCITITKKTKEIHQIPIHNGAIAEYIRTTHQLLSDPKSDLVQLSHATRALYELLVYPNIKNKNSGSLIIVPDGLLNYLPFGSLQTKANKTHYLIEEKAISYANSLTLLRQLQHKKNQNTKLTAFAPSFQNSGEKNTTTQDASLLSLPNNGTEARQVSSYFESQLFTDQEASLENFKNQNSKFGIIHLATHAILNNEAPEYSYLAFTPQENKENRLFIRDLYNYQLDAQLVTLSTCESGIGVLKKGEGFISLARSFFYAGAASIVNTQWRINDTSSSKIMDYFYKYLSKGQTKGNALRRAKLDFINSNRQNALKHPYYWAGIVITGDNSPVVSTYNYWVFSLICGSLLFVLVWKIIKK